jgi:hypothetical protein
MNIKLINLTHDVFCNYFYAPEKKANKELKILKTILSLLLIKL